MRKGLTKYMLIAFVIGFLVACVSIAARFVTVSNPNVTSSSDGKYV